MKRLLITLAVFAVVAVILITAVPAFAFECGTYIIAPNGSETLFICDEVQVQTWIDNLIWQFVRFFYGM